MLINYEGSYDQEVFPKVGCRGHQVNFFVTVEAKKLDSVESYSDEFRNWRLHGGWENPC